MGVDHEDFVAELTLERAVVRRIAQTHADHVQSVRRFATGMAEEASFLSEEGPRETEAESGDEDGEAAAAAASARTAAASVVKAWKRVRDLESGGDALAFGRITDEEETNYIGRRSVIRGDDVLLIDWRAAAATPFYRATPLEPLGLSHRRHLHYTNDELSNYSDEIFNPEDVPHGSHLRGEAALLTTLAGHSDGRMKSVVATIQAEQDAVIRASERGPVLVQGGPGTGKTVVALHRAAYLLYADRAALAETGVLIVGPSPEFLTYVSEVLPSLGESGVVSKTAEQLYIGVLVDPDPSIEMARLKGSDVMVKLLATAVRDRQRQPVEPLVVWYGSRRLSIELEALTEFFGAAQRQFTHNSGSRVLRSSILDRLIDEIYEPGFETRADLSIALRDSRDVHIFMERHWPVLTPEQTLNDLFGSPALLRSAAQAAGLSDTQRGLLETERSTEEALRARRWHRSDVPLLDELLHVLGDVGDSIDRDEDMEHIVADESDVFTRAEEDDEHVDLSDSAFDDETADIEYYDGWTDGDEQATWR